MDWLLPEFLLKLAQTLPIILGLGLLTVVVTFSPLGRSLVRYLREKRREAEISESILAELTGMREELSEVLQRLDGTERMLSQFKYQTLREGIQLQPGTESREVRTPTPH